MPIRPVINNKLAPSHKLAKYLNEKIHSWQILPNTYNARNSLDIAEELVNLEMNISNRIITLDIKDLYTNLLKQGILMATKHWLGLGMGSKEENEELLMSIGTIMQQNYFQYNNTFYRPSKGVAMGSPLSGTLAELYLQFLEKQYIKHWISSREVSYYKRYVDDILLIYNENRITKENILQEFNKVDSNLEFKMTTEDNKCISFLDLNIHRKPNRIELGKYKYKYFHTQPI